MFRKKTIVLSVCAALSLTGCASFDRLADRTSQAIGLAPAQRPALTAEQLYELGKRYQAETRYERAIAAYVEALEHDHTLADAHNALGVVYAEQGRYEDAIVEFKAAIDLKPGTSYLHSNLGYSLLLQGSMREASYALEIALQLEPTNERAKLNLLIARQRLGNSIAPAPAVAHTPSTPPRQKEPGAKPGTTIDPRLIAVAPGIYELKPREVSEPEVASAQLPQFEETPLAPPSFQQPAAKARLYRLEISNGNGRSGMARRVARLLDEKGIHASRISNHQSFREASTQIEYRNGYLMEASHLREYFPGQVIAVPSSSLRKDIHVRVVLGRDVGTMTALSRPVVTAGGFSTPSPVGMP